MMFEIYLTPEGPVLLEGEQKIRTMDAILNGNRTFSEIVSATGLAKSTALFNIRKLIEDEMIIEKDGVYSTLALGLIKTADRDESDYILSKKVTQSLFPDTIERFIVSFPVLNGHKFGVSIAPIIVELGKIIGRVAYEHDVDISLEAAIKRTIDFFDKANYADVELVSMMPLSFLIKPRFESTDDSLLTFCEIVIRMITEYLSLVTSTTYYVTDLVKGDNQYKMVMGFKEIEPQYTNTRYHGYEFKPDAKSDFWVYFTKESFVPVIGEIPMKMMECIEKRRYSSKELSVELNIPQTTLIGYLKKMETDKLIVSEKVGNKSVYKMNSDRIFAWGTPRTDLLEERYRYIAEIWNNPEHMFRWLLYFLVIDSAYLGFDVKNYLRFTGKYLGNSVCAMVPEMTVEEMLRTLSSNAEDIASSRLAVKSFNPLTIAKTTLYDLNEWTAECQAVLYSSLFCTILENKMGVPYSVRSEEIYGEGNRGYEVVFVPDVY